MQCDTITNVRVTDRTIEETIRLDFTIRRAGVRAVSFLLPKEMADSRISVPLLRQKTIEPAGDRVRVRIELQDERIGQLMVAVTDDRLLTPGMHEAPIPDSRDWADRPALRGDRAGRPRRSGARGPLREVEALGPRQEAAENLMAILGHELTMAYVVAADAAEPRLRFRTETHAAVATVKASIGLARTRLVLDANGAYRAEVSLAVNNATEQFLDVRLPPAARLWTVRVAGEPVKPTRVPGSADPQDVRIPLIKTAAGEGAYDVVLKYGGDVRPLTDVRQRRFPHDPLPQHPARAEPGVALSARRVPLVRLRRHDAPGGRTGRPRGGLCPIPNQADWAEPLGAARRRQMDEGPRRRQSPGRATEGEARDTTVPMGTNAALQSELAANKAP